jgi:hypothetical protein
MVSSLNNRPWLTFMEKLVGDSVAGPRETDLPQLFCCRLEEQPDHLVAGRYLTSQAGAELANTCLLVNPECVFTRDGELPDQFSGTPWLFSNFDLHGTLVWVKDPGPGTTAPFSLGPKLATVFSTVRPGEPAPELPPRWRSVLQMAGVLVSENLKTEACNRWAERVSSSGAAFRQRKYAPVAGLIHPFHLAALRRYYRQLIRTRQISLGDEQSPRRYAAHNESVARFFHHQLTRAVAAISGEPVKPSYVYVGSYQSGAELEKHTDREQCEFSISLCLDYWPEPQNETPWPLKLETDSSEVAVFQGIGDGLLYRGRELPHWRDRLPEGHTSTSVFFHYVAADFAGPLD